jgi:hypothetical protein
MRIRTGLGLLISGICCGAVLAGCTTGPPKGPDATVSTPNVGGTGPSGPQAPASAQAALSSEAFTPYASLGPSNDDGLAPGESDFTLAASCMTLSGYPASATTDNVPIDISLGASLSFSPPWGNFGYLGAPEAEQYGFRPPPGSVASPLGIPTPSDTNPPSLPAAEQAAQSKCATIMQDYDATTRNAALAGIAAVGNDISTDVAQDAAVKAATGAWSACMAKNGYSFHQPQAVFFQQLTAMRASTGIPASGATQISPAVNQAQIAAAVTDADCTQSSDLAGIYFAVQASYEQQLTGANQQALNAAVRQYRAGYAKELSKLPALLATAKVQPYPGSSTSTRAAA